jgi:hypothetical protein
VWRVGNGSQIRIWKDRWIPKPTTFRIQSTPRVLDEEATVDNLIDKDTKWWDPVVLGNLFEKEEVQMIQSIPLSNTNQRDMLIWRGTANGLFSVKSAYYIQQELLATSLAVSTSGAGKQGCWKDIWALPVPNVEKNFMWRACHDLLPTRVNLFRRKVITDPSCLFCGAAAETGFHVLWDCPSAKDVWSMACGVLQKSSYLALIFYKLWKGFSANVGRRTALLFVGIARRIWMRRNEVLHGGSFTHPSVIIQQVQKAIEEFQQAQRTR